jgi:hypothetical protein
MGERDAACPQRLLIQPDPPPPPPGRHPTPKEEYLAEEEFESVFGMDKEDFRAMPPWKRINAKKSKGLF